MTERSAPSASAGDLPVWSVPTDGFGIWLCLALAAALRIWTISEKNLWLDESMSWHLATSSVSGLIDWTAADIHPPLYYLILKGWVGVFGDSLVALRSLSVVASLTAVWLLFKLVDAAVPRLVAYGAVFWLAVSPHAIYYAQEARMYALVTAIVLAAALAYRRWVDSAFTRPSNLLVYACCATAGLYVHYFTVLALAAIWVHFALCAPAVCRASLQGRPELNLKVCPSYEWAWAYWLNAHVAVAMAYSPWITTMVEQLSRGQSWRQPVTLAQIPAVAGELLWMLTFGMYGQPFIGWAPDVLVLGVLAAGIVAVVIAAFRPGGERDAFFASMAVVPIVLGLSLLLGSGHMDLSRYLPYAAPLLIAATARGVSLLPLRAAQAAAILLVGTLGLYPSLRLYYRNHVKDSDARPIVSYLIEHARHADGNEQDLIYVAPDYMTKMVTFISRDELGYRQVSDGDRVDLKMLSSEPGHPTWLIVDYRWAGFPDVGKEAGFELVDVPENASGRIRLFRVRAQ